jgi:hypothetical protein
VRTLNLANLCTVPVVESARKGNTIIIIITIIIIKVVAREKLGWFWISGGLLLKGS